MRARLQPQAGASLVPIALRKGVIALFRMLWLIVLVTAMVSDAIVCNLAGQLTSNQESARWNHRWCRRLLRATGIDFHVSGEPPGTLAASGATFEALVCNHMSYLDILLLGAALPCIMVAKSEVRAWPVVGWITKRAGTVYVYRGGRRETYREVNEAMAQAFRSGLPVVFFPEGTTTDGSELLPFRRGLFHSVLRDAVQLRTAAIRYTLHSTDDGSVEEDICWTGDDALLPHLWRLLGMRGITASLRFGPAARGDDRFALSEDARATVSNLYAQIAAEAELVSQPVADALYQPNLVEFL